MATPSRRWAERAPSRSTHSCATFGSTQGSLALTSARPTALAPSAPHRRPIRVDQHARLLRSERHERRLQPVGGGDIGDRCEMSGDLFRHPVRIDKQLARPCRRTMAWASTTGVCGTSWPRMLNAQAIELGSVSTAHRLAPYRAPRRVRRACPPPIGRKIAPGEPKSACRRATAGRPRSGRRDWAGPAKAGPDTVAGGAQLVGSFGGDEPGIVAEDVAGGEVRRNPFMSRLLDAVLAGEDRGIDLLPDLDRVAAVSEYDRVLRRHDAIAGRSGEAGQPAQPLGIAGRHTRPDTRRSAARDRR